MTRCRCRDDFLLFDRLADEYADGHLVREDVQGDGPGALYRCPDTGLRWALDFPQREGKGTAVRLRLLDLNAVQMVRLLTREDLSLAERLALVDPQIEYQPLPDSRVYRGAGEVERYAAQAAAAGDRPKASPLRIVDRGDDALVLGEVGYPRDGSYVEFRPAAWIVTVREGRVLRITAHASWEKARAVLGLTARESERGFDLRRRLWTLLGRPLARPAV